MFPFIFGDHKNPNSKWLTSLCSFCPLMICFVFSDTLGGRYNMGTAGGAYKDTWNYLNVPWGGVKESSLRDVVIEKSGKSELLTPLAGWGQDGQILKNLNTFGGYTAFAQALPRAAKAVVLPAGVALVKNGNCGESKSHSDSRGKCFPHKSTKTTKTPKP
jgi:hypothetical protein